MLCLLLQGLPDPDDRSCLSAFFINGAQLFEKNDGIPDNVVSRCVDLDVRRQFGFIHLGSNGSTDHCRAVFVPDIVLDDEYRTDPPAHFLPPDEDPHNKYLLFLYSHSPHSDSYVLSEISDIYSISLFIRCMQVYKKFIDGCSLFGR